MSKKFILSLVMVTAVVAAGYVGYGSYGQQSEKDALLLENVEALAKDPEGNTVRNGMESHFKCGVPYQGSACTTEVITCPGGGTGCTPRNCPLHG